MDETGGRDGGRNWFDIVCRQADLRSLLKASRIDGMFIPEQEWKTKRNI